MSAITGSVELAGFVACDGFSSAQVAKFGSDSFSTACRSLNAKCIGLLKPASLTSLNGNCLKSMNATALDAAQVHEVCHLVLFDIIVIIIINVYVISNILIFLKFEIF